MWTAGHCVASPGVGFHTNFSFAPARRGGTNPYGLWTTKIEDGVWTLAGWFDSGLFSFDHGALVMKPNSGAKIGNKVGFLGFAANVSRQQHWHVHGYPKAARNLAQTPPGAQFDGSTTRSARRPGPPTTQRGRSPGPAGHRDRLRPDGRNERGAMADRLQLGVGRHESPQRQQQLQVHRAESARELEAVLAYFSDGAVNLRNAAQAVPVP